MYTHFIRDNASPSLRGGHLHQTWAGCSYLRLRIQIQLLALRATEPGDLHKSCFALGGVPTALPGSEMGNLSQIPAGRSKPERQLNSVPLWTPLPDPSRRRREDQAGVPASSPSSAPHWSAPTKWGPEGSLSQTALGSCSFLLAALLLLPPCWDPRSPLDLPAAETPHN